MCVWGRRLLACLLSCASYVIIYIYMYVYFIRLEECEMNIIVYLRITISVCTYELTDQKFKETRSFG